NGNFEVPLSLEGSYRVSLLKDGNTVKVISVQALPKSTPGEGEQPPTTIFQDGGMAIFLLILLVLLVAGLVYWRGRGKKGGKQPGIKNVMQQQV
ncbi:MAG: hypothetical protein AB1324_06480, partial [Candidatus Micrarchaeota archaeon]